MWQVSTIVCILAAVWLCAIPFLERACCGRHLCLDGEFGSVSCSTTAPLAPAEVAVFFRLDQQIAGSAQVQSCLIFLVGNLADDCGYLGLDVGNRFPKQGGLLRNLLFGQCGTGKATSARAERRGSSVQAGIAASSSGDVAVPPMLAVHETTAYPISVKFFFVHVVPLLPPYSVWVPMGVHVAVVSQSTIRSSCCCTVT